VQINRTETRLAKDVILDPHRPSLSGGLSRAYENAVLRFKTDDPIHFESSIVKKTMRTSSNRQARWILKFERARFSLLESALENETMP